MRDLAIATYAVDPQRISELLPHSFEPRSFTLADGREAAFVSAVAFRNEAVETNGLRFPISYLQVNFRAYVERGGEPCVWFFGSALSTPLVWFPQALLGMPWHHGTLTLLAQWYGAACEGYRFGASGPLGESDLTCASDGRQPAQLDGFASVAEGLEVLTQPLAGFVQRRNGRLLELDVTHDRLTPASAEATTASFELFERLALVEPGTKPHSVLLVKDAVFHAFAPRFY